MQDLEQGPGIGVVISHFVAVAYGSVLSRHLPGERARAIKLAYGDRVPAEVIFRRGCAGIVLTPGISPDRLLLLQYRFLHAIGAVHGICIKHDVP